MFTVQMTIAYHKLENIYNTVDTQHTMNTAQNTSDSYNALLHAPYFTKLFTTTLVQNIYSEKYTPFITFLTCIPLEKSDSHDIISQKKKRLFTLKDGRWEFRFV